MDPTPRIAAVFLLISLAPPSLPIVAKEGAEGSRPVAIVYRLEGVADVHDAGNAGTDRRSLKLFERLGSGAEVTTGPGSQVEVVFRDGERFRLAASSRALVRARRLDAPRDAVSRLEPVPVTVPFASLVDVAAARKPGSVRIRQVEDPVGLRPGRDEPVPAQEVVLSFPPRNGVATYRLTVEDVTEAGRVVYEVETAAVRVEVPAPALEAGRSYYWHVADAATGRPLKGYAALFRTLPAETARLRAELSAGVARSDDPGLKLVLAALDHHLGLVTYACARLREVVRDQPDDRALLGHLEEADCPPP